MRSLQVKSLSRSDASFILCTLSQVTLGWSYLADQASAGLGSLTSRIGWGPNSAVPVAGTMISAGWPAEGLLTKDVTSIHVL